MSHKLKEDNQILSKKRTVRDKSLAIQKLLANHLEKAGKNYVMDCQVIYEV